MTIARNEQINLWYTLGYLSKGGDQRVEPLVVHQLAHSEQVRLRVAECLHIGEQLHINAIVNHPRFGGNLWSHSHGLIQ